MLATPRFVREDARRRRMPHPRRAAVAFVCVIATLVSCGLSAAGALPEPLQTHHRVDRTHLRRAAHRSTRRRRTQGLGGAIPPRRRRHRPRPTRRRRRPHAEPPHRKTPTPHQARADHARPRRAAPAAGSETPIAKTPTHAVRRSASLRSTPGRRPRTNSSNTPPGYPGRLAQSGDRRGGDPARQACAQATALTPAGLPAEVRRLRRRRQPAGSVVSGRC